MRKSPSNASFTLVDSTGESIGSSFDTYLVIGGSGFLGSAITSLLLSQSKKVKVFDLHPPKLDVEFFKGSLTDKESLLKATTGISVVIHTASPPHGKSKDVYFEVNVDGTNNVIEACIENRVRSLVYTSSAGVVYNGNSLVNVNENEPYCKVHMDFYNETKMLAEINVVNANKKGGLKTVVIRPTGIFGPGDMQGTFNILKAAKNGNDGVKIGNNSTLFDWTYVDNAAYAHILAADKVGVVDGIDGQVFFITNDSPIFCWDLIKLMYHEYGKRDTLRYTIPLPVAYFLAYFVQVFVALLSPFVTLHPTFTIFRIQIMTNNKYHDISKAKSLLGYKPIVPLAEGIRRAVKYFKDLEKEDEASKAKNE